MRRIFPVLLLLVVISAAWARSSNLNLAKVRESGLTQRQAETVLRLVLKQSDYKKGIALPGAYIEGGFLNKDGAPSTTGFYLFRLAYDSPKAGATEYFGNFLVSQKTGDVWDVSLSSACHRFDFPALARLQAAIMKKTKMTIDGEKPLRDNFDCD